MQKIRLSGFKPEDPVTYQLPNQMVLLAQALQPVSESVHVALQRQLSVGEAIESDGGSDPAEHLSAISVVMEQLGSWMQELNVSVMQNPQATPMEFGFVAGRLEQLLRPLMDG